MRTEPGLHGSPPNLTSREQGESLRLLEESQALLRAILLGLPL